MYFVCNTAGKCRPSCFLLCECIVFVMKNKCLSFLVRDRQGVLFSFLNLAVAAQGDSGRLVLPGEVIASHPAVQSGS